MIGDDIYKRAKTLAGACTKLALVLPQTHALSGVARGELIKHSSELGIKARGLMHTQLPSNFITNLYQTREAADGICYWLEYVNEQQLIEEGIVQPIYTEADQLIAMFSKAIIKIKDKLD